MTFQTEKTTILPLGDSITSGFPYSYRYKLYHLLRSAGLTFEYAGSVKSNPAMQAGDWDMVHEGHPGWTTAMIEHELPSWLINYRPDMALLHIGTNDMMEISLNMAKLSDSLDALHSIIVKLRGNNPAIVILLAQIIPISRKVSENCSELVKVWNKRLIRFSDNESSVLSPIHNVDMHLGFSENDLLDGVHPNEKGANKMAARWAEALLGLINNK